MFAFFHIELTAQDPRRLPRARAGRAADVRHLRALPARRTATCWSALLPWNFFDGDANGAARRFGAGTVGVGIFGAFWSWIGFEMAPNYAEESQDPKRIMVPGDLHLGHRPRRPLHVHLLDARGRRGARTASPAASPRSSTATSRRSSTRRPTGVFPIDLGSASLLTRAFQLTIVTGSFACQLAFFNTATRYLFSMGREGILPASARAHASHAQEPARRGVHRRRASQR